MKGYFYLASEFITRHKVRLFFLQISIVIGVTAVFVLFSFHLGVEQILTSRAIASIGTKEIVVKPAYRNGLLMVNKEEKKEMNVSTVDEITHIGGVEKVYPTTVLQLPTSIKITFMGNTFESDAPVYGIPTEMVQGELKDPSAFKSNGSTIPVLLSQDIIDFFNAGFSDSLGLPKVSEEYLTSNTIGQPMTIIFGYSSFLGFKGADVIEAPGTVIGFSHQAPLVGITIPLETLQEYAKKFNKGMGKINSLLVTVQNPIDVDRVSAAIENLGYSTDSLQKRIAGVQDNIKILSLLIGTLSVIILLATCISLFNTFLSDVYQSIPTIGLLRSVGATRGFIFSLFLSKACIVSGIGGVLGTVLGYAIAHITSLILLQSLPFFMSAQVQLTVTPWYLIVFTILFSVLLGVISTFYPAYRATRYDPASALRY